MLGERGVSGWTLQERYFLEGAGRSCRFFLVFCGKMIFRFLGKKGDVSGGVIEERIFGRSQARNSFLDEFG